jgi:hypothetical protein
MHAHVLQSRPRPLSDLFSILIRISQGRTSPKKPRGDYETSLRTDRKSFLLRRIDETYLGRQRKYRSAFGLAKALRPRKTLGARSENVQDRVPVREKDQPRSRGPTRDSPNVTSPWLCVMSRRESHERRLAFQYSARDEACILRASQLRVLHGMATKRVSKSDH